MVNIMLTDDQIKEAMPYLEKIAKAQDVTLEEAIKVLAAAVVTVEENPRVIGKPWKTIFSRARSVVDMHFNNRKKRGETFIIIPFGPLSETKDWNAGEYRQNEVDVFRDGGIKKLIKEGRIMTKKNGDGSETPISKVTNHALVDRFIKGNEILLEEVPDSKPIKLYVVVDGEEWKKGEGLPLFRDNRMYSNNNVNFNFSHPLMHRWEFSLVGLGWPKENSEDTRLFEVKVRYEQADPDSDKFFFKHHQMFKAYTDNFETDPKSTGWKYILTTSYLSPKASDYDTADLDITLSDMIAFIHEKFDKEAATKGDELPEFIDGMVGIQDYHALATQKDKGKVIKSESGWDRTKWNKYAIISCYMNSMKEPAGSAKNPSYAIFDSEINKRMTVFGSKYIYNQPQLPGHVMMMIKTSRKPERYDFATRTSVYDPENGDLSINAYSIINIGGVIKIEDTKTDGVVL